MTRPRRHVAALRERSPFYRDKLAGIEDAPFEALPFTTKDEIRASLAAEPPLGRHLAAPLEDVRRIYSTSGTTGDPSYIAVTDADLAGWTDIGARSYAATGIAPGAARGAHLQLGPVRGRRRARRLGPHRRDRRSRSAAATPSGSCGRSRCSAPRRSAARRPTRSTSPTGAASAGSSRASSACACSPSPASRAAERTRPAHAIEEAFGATVREAMGIADVSPSLWGECEEQAGMHFCGEGHVHVELIDPESGALLPFEDQAEGELVYTVAAPRGDAGAALPLAATASWSTRSRARAGAARCACAASAAPTTS